MAIQQIDSDGQLAPELLREGDYRAILELLEQRVPANLFQLCWLENHGVRPRSDPDLFAFRGIKTRRGELAAVSLAITDRLVLVESEEPEASGRLGRWYRRQGMDFGHVVSAADRVGPFWEGYAGGDSVDRRARLDRDQVMFHLAGDARESWKSFEAGGEAEGLRLARPRDFDPLYLASARMHREETLQDPLEDDAEGFRRHVRHRIESDRTWVWFDDGRLIFKADVSARSRHGVQISGVYTVPDRRGEGLATRGMAAICRRLLDDGIPRVVLYVNRENEAARRVYEKVGFAEYVDYRTVFVADTPGAGAVDGQGGE